MGLTTTTVLVVVLCVIGTWGQIPNKVVGRTGNMIRPPEEVFYHVVDPELVLPDRIILEWETVEIDRPMSISTLKVPKTETFVFL